MNTHSVLLSEQVQQLTDDKAVLSKQVEQLTAEIAALNALVVRKDEALREARKMLLPSVFGTPEKEVERLGPIYVEALALTPSDLAGCVVLRPDAIPSLKGFINLHAKVATLMEELRVVKAELLKECESHNLTKSKGDNEWRGTNTALRATNAALTAALGEIIQMAADEGKSRHDILCTALARRRAVEQTVPEPGTRAALDIGHAKFLADIEQTKKDMAEGQT